MSRILPRARQAFSLAELMVSVGIVAVGILMVIGIFIGLLHQSQRSADRSAGTVVASSMLNQEIYQILNNTHPTVTKADFFDLDSPPEPPLQGTVNLNGTVFTYTVRYQTVDDNTGSPLGDGLNNARVKRTDVTVWWWTDTADTARKGYGYLRTQLTRLVNEGDTF
ncbi:MAG: hypothetical protein AB1758_20285 [Candidatus Eremiobacterota bacterium]